MLVQTIHVFSEKYIEKYAMLLIEKRKIVKSGGIEFPYGKVI